MSGKSNPNPPPPEPEPAFRKWRGRARTIDPPRPLNIEWPNLELPPAMSPLRKSRPTAGSGSGSDPLGGFLQTEREETVTRVVDEEAEPAHNREPIPTRDNTNLLVPAFRKGRGMTRTIDPPRPLTIEFPEVLSCVNPDRSPVRKSRRTALADLPGGFLRNETETKRDEVTSPLIDLEEELEVEAVPPMRDPDRWKERRFVRTQKGTAYLYQTLLTYKKELDSRPPDSDCYKVIKHPCFLYGIVEDILYSRTPASHEVKIRDETLEGITLRIHASATEPLPGPPISKNDIIRVHRATIQEENRDGKREMVVSTTPHHNYTLFSCEADGDIKHATSAKKITFQASDRKRIQELKQTILSRREENDLNESNSGQNSMNI